MRLILRVIACIVFALGLAWTCESPATAGPAQEMLPDQSAARARQVLQQVIAALGGPAYLNARDSQCEGRAAEFGTAGTLMGFTQFRELWLLPDKDRVEYFSKGEHTIAGFLMGSDDLLITHGGAIITVQGADGGWTLDKSGVSDEPEDQVKSFNEQLKSSLNYVLRKRMNEAGMDVQYDGPDLIDMKEAEWIEFNDSDHRNMRLGIDRFTHLPLRWVVTTRDPETRVNTAVTTSYTQYMTLDGIKTPLSVELARNERKLSQTFFNDCKYNSDLAPELFTRSWLEQHAAEVTKKKYKESKTSN